MPYLIEDEEGNVQGNDWAKGFLTGTHIHHDAWTEVLNDRERAGPLVCIFFLAYEHSDDPKLRPPFDKPITQEARETLIAGMIAGVKSLYDMFQNERGASGGVDLRRRHEKVGRNDPCPCGSGKKFKKCCGQTTVH